MKKWMGGILLGFIVSAAVLVGTYRYRDAQKRREQARQALQMIRQDIEEKARLASLGDISIDPSGLTLGKLNDILRQPAHKLTSAATSTRLGWACGGELCAVEAAFAIPAGTDVPSSAAPMLLSASGVGFGKPFQGSIGGIHLGDPVDVVLNVCRQHGYEVKEPHRISWDKDWEVAWTESDHHTVSSLFFWNRTILNVMRASLKGHSIEN
jgi:hypothetical protein